MRGGRASIYVVWAGWRGQRQRQRQRRRQRGVAAWAWAAGVRMGMRMGMPGRREKGPGPAWRCAAGVRRASCVTSGRPPTVAESNLGRGAWRSNGFPRFCGHCNTTTASPPSSLCPCFDAPATATTAAPAGRLAPPLLLLRAPALPPRHALLGLDIRPLPAPCLALQRLHKMPRPQLALTRMPRRHPVSVGHLPSARSFWRPAGLQTCHSPLPATSPHVESGAGAAAMTFARGRV